MEVVVAILAKDKAQCLSLFLNCILQQTYAKEKIHLYIRTNDNSDSTEEILRNFIRRFGHLYASCFFNSDSILERLKNYKPHEWNAERFKVLGKIRQDSIEYAISKNAHYFVADCDNFISPDTLEKLFLIRHMGVVAPILFTQNTYSNYHYEIDSNGYYAPDPRYYTILKKEIMGCFEVKVVHCTYFVANQFLGAVCYDDGSRRYEYVIFSESMRKNGIPQVIDNRIEGFLTLKDGVKEVEDEVKLYKYPWIKNLPQE